MPLRWSAFSAPSGYTGGVRLAAAFFAAILLLQAADPLAARTRAKFTQIKQDKAKRGSVIVVTPQELNAWVREELGEEQLGLREPKVEFGDGTVQFEVLADFRKLAGSEGMLGKLLEGERPIKLVAQPDTADGKVTVKLKLLEISGIPLTGVLLDFAAKLVINQIYDDVEIGQPFAMGHNIDHAVIDPAALRIYIKR